MTARKKRLVIAGCTLMFFLIVVITLFIYPNHLFAHHEKYKKFSIYSGQPIKGNYRLILDRSLELAGKSEIFDATYNYDIFLTEGVWYKKYAETLSGPSLARSIDNNILLNGTAVFIKNELGTSNKRELMQTITHEMVHCLMLNMYGMLKINPLYHPPVWKMEVYPEIIAMQHDINRKDYDFRQTVTMLKSYVDSGKLWIEIKPGFADPLSYFKARVLVEYLITRKNMTLDQIMDKKVKEDEVYNDLMHWYKNKH